MTTAEILARCRGSRRWWWATSVSTAGAVTIRRSDPSRETGIPRTRWYRSRSLPGAGGTVANNLAALGVGRVAVLGVRWRGWPRSRTRASLERSAASNPISRYGAPQIQTFTYTKIINQATGIEDRPRIDFINISPILIEIEREILDRLQQAIEVRRNPDRRPGGNKSGRRGDPGGAATAGGSGAEVSGEDHLGRFAARIAQFRNVILKPNQQEAAVACNGDYSAWRRSAGAPLLMVTHGSEGVLVVDDAGERWVKTKTIEYPVDICGAGDSFSAGAATGSAHYTIARLRRALRQSGRIHYRDEAWHGHGVAGRNTGIRFRLRLTGCPPAQMKQRREHDRRRRTPPATSPRRARRHRRNRDRVV